MSATREPSVSARSLYLALASRGIPIDHHIAIYNLEMIEPREVVALIQQARQDLDSLRAIADSQDENDLCIREEGAR